MSINSYKQIAYINKNWANKICQLKIKTCESPKPSVPYAFIPLSLKSIYGSLYLWCIGVNNSSRSLKMTALENLMSGYHQLPLSASALSVWRSDEVGEVIREEREKSDWHDVQINGGKIQQGKKDRTKRKDKDVV